MKEEPAKAALSVDGRPRIAGLPVEPYAAEVPYARRSCGSPGAPSGTTTSRLPRPRGPAAASTSSRRSSSASAGGARATTSSPTHTCPPFISPSGRAAPRLPLRAARATGSRRAREILERSLELLRRPAADPRRWFSASARRSESALSRSSTASQYGAWLLCFGRKVNHFTGVGRRRRGLAGEAPARRASR